QYLFARSEQPGLYGLAPDAIISAGRKRIMVSAPVAEKAPYFHRSWVRVKWDNADPDAMRHRLITSYDIVRASLTKKAQAALPERD
ncbi:MAG: hypothetical protein AAFR57_17550, partial [Pseudomonadota bacterium]